MIWSEQNIKDLKKLAITHTNIELLDFFPDKTYKQIQKKINNLRIQRNPETKSRSYRKYSINSNYFKIYSHNMAYILGLWWADGSICPSPSTGKIYEFNITNKYDKPLLENIRNEMNSNIPIKIHKKTGSFVLKIFNITICKDIQKLGGISNKSKEFIWPILPDQYFSSFLRGLFDGDGGIFCNENHINYHYYSGSICSGNSQFIIKLREKIFNDYSIKTHFYEHSNKENYWYVITFNQSQLKKFGYVIYDNLTNLFLQYKYNLFYNLYNQTSLIK